MARRGTSSFLPTCWANGSRMWINMSWHASSWWHWVEGRCCVVLFVLPFEGIFSQWDALSTPNIFQLQLVWLHWTFVSSPWCFPKHVSSDFKIASHSKPSLFSRPLAEMKRALCWNSASHHYFLWNFIGRKKGVLGRSLAAILICHDESALPCGSCFCGEQIISRETAKSSYSLWVIVFRLSIHEAL